MSDELFEKACEEAAGAMWESETDGPWKLAPVRDRKALIRDMTATVRAAVAPYVERIVELEAAAEASVQECARLREALDDNAESLRYEVDACAAQRERAERMRQLVARLAGVEAALADAQANHVEERDELLHERKLLVEVATRALQLQALCDSGDGAGSTYGRARRDLRAALEAWTSDPASQWGEDE